MSVRAIATASIAFGLVSIPVKVYSATQAVAALRFKLMGRGGTRVRQQYVEETLPEPTMEVADPEPRTLAAPARAALRLADASRDQEPANAARQDSLDRAKDDNEPVITRDQMVKGYEFEKGRYVLFTEDELRALETPNSETIDIVAFVPARSVDPLYYERAFLLGPDRRGERAYALLAAALDETERTAIARWAWRGKSRIVELRPGDGGW